MKRNDLTINSIIYVLKRDIEFMKKEKRENVQISIITLEELVSAYEKINLEILKIKGDKEAKEELLKMALERIKKQKNEEVLPKDTEIIS